jgi:hypothetical protein
MSTTYQWQINKLECLPTEEKIVCKVDWSLSATRNNISSYCSGSIDLNCEELDEENFIEYSQLTEEIVLEWTKDYINLYQEWNSEENLKVVLEQQLNAIENQHLINQELPWGSDL